MQMNNFSHVKNRRVLNTRPVHLAEATAHQIRLSGGISIAFPLLTITATDANWTHSLPALNTIQHAIFISPNAVTYFFKAIAKNKFPQTITTYALGSGTEAVLKRQNIQPILPLKADSEHLLMLESLQAVQDQAILLIKGNDGRTYIQDGLIQRGAHITPIEVYERTCPKPNPSYAKTLWHEDAVDIILITSQTVLEHLFVLFDHEAADWLCSKICWVISDRLAKAAKEKGFKHIIKRTLSS
jgi:uroporphyrinogen-III synthase